MEMSTCPKVDRRLPYKGSTRVDNGSVQDTTKEEDHRRFSSSTWEKIALALSISDIFTLVSNDTDICIKVHQYQISTYGSTDFRDRWYWESDPFDTGAA